MLWIDKDNGDLAEGNGRFKKRKPLGGKINSETNTRNYPIHRN
jgi:hypothetical protein